MAWSMPTAGQWNPGIGMAPDMNMGSYTPDQWAAMQQQNWQQWSQWQQQYAQWQNQYGEKYAEQMQVMQAMGGMPPLPPANTAPPPAPPPPDQPPPPPHENNQPLFGKPPAPSLPAPVPPPSGNQPRNINAGNYNNTNTQAGNNSNWSYATETSQQQQSSINADALKKLAEEERLFDIQFQKWEEEIQKWKKENVNHPDKQAYKEYEQKFEACRAQLMERRQQMNQKRARLMGTASQPPENTNTPLAGNISSPVPPPQKPLGNNNFSNIQTAQKPLGNNNYANMQTPQKPLGNSNYPNMQTPQTPLGSNNNHPNMQTSQKPPSNNNYPTMQTHQKPLSNNNYPNMQTQQYNNNAPPNYQDQANPHQRQQYNAPQTGYNRSNNKNVDTQDRYEAYQHADDNNYPPMTANFSAPDNSTFLPKTSSSKGIPGLDLVHEGDKRAANKLNDVIDITEERNDDQLQSQEPDYSKISKGINNILGDEKIMNILSMVCGQQTHEATTSAPNVPAQNAPYGGNNLRNPPYNQGNRNQNYNNQQYDNRQNAPFNRQGQNYQGQNQDVGNYAPPNKMYIERQDEMPQEQYGYNRDPQFRDHEISPAYDNGPPNRPPAPVRPNIPPGRPPPRPLMHELISQPNANNYPPMLNERRPLRDNNTNPIVSQPPPPRPKWVEEPLFTPSIIVEYEHKPLRLKAREFIEPVHMFDYNHKSKDGDDSKRRDFEKEADELFSRKPRRSEKDLDYSADRFSRDHYCRDYERRVPREEMREDFRPRPPRDEFDDRRRPDTRFDDRRRDDRDKYNRRDEPYGNLRERDRDFQKDRSRDIRRENSRQRSRSHERDTRKRALSKDSDISVQSLTKKSKENNVVQKSEKSKHIVMIDDLLESPGREMRPAKIVIILRGPPGSGKSYLAKLIRDREAEHGGTVRIMSIDDYFMQEGEVEEKDPTTGKMIKKPTLKYEYDEKSESTYLNSLKRAFKRSLMDGYFSFLIYDSVNENLRSYADVWNFARQNGFQVYVCTMELDPQVCYKRNIHNRKLDDIEVICARFVPTSASHIQLDATTLLQNAAITDVHMEDADDEVIMEDAGETEVESVFTSKWEKMDDAAQLARLDGISKPLRPSQLSMEDYLQLDDWKPTTAKPGKKNVRWADLEERREQEKMRAIGFVVGQTDWNRMTDPTMGSSALTQTKYIERVRRN